MSGLRIGSGMRALTSTRPQAGSLANSLSASAGFSMGKSIEMEEAVALKGLLLGSARKVYPEGWTGQAFTFVDDIGFGLVQKRGGPCGVLAAVQAFILKYLLFSSPNASAPDDIDRLKPSSEQRDQALIHTLTHILMQVSH